MKVYVYCEENIYQKAFEDFVNSLIVVMELLVLVSEVICNMLLELYDFLLVSEHNVN
jgi:hypothetical protein